MNENCQSASYQIEDKQDTTKFGPRWSHEALAMADENGWSVRYPSDTELFVDIDDRAGLIRLVRARKSLREFLEIQEIVRTPSKSGKPNKFHVVVKLKNPISPLERILLQALFGSDQMREIFSYQNLKRGDAHPTLFYEKES